MNTEIPNWNQNSAKYKYLEFIFLRNDQETKGFNKWFYCKFAKKSPQPVWKNFDGQNRRGGKISDLRKNIYPCFLTSRYGVSLNLGPYLNNCFSLSLSIMSKLPVII